MNDINQPAQHFLKAIKALNHFLRSHGINIEIGSGLGLLLISFCVLVASSLAYFIAKKASVKVLKPIIHRTKYQWDNIALRKGMFKRLAHFAPGMVIYLSSPLFNLSDTAWGTTLSEFVRRGAVVYMVVAGALVIDSVLNTLAVLYDNLDRSRQKPIRSYIQVIKILLFLVAGIVVLSALLNQSPWAFLTGLGAMTAVVMLVFKDSILGFVASVQMNAYDMVRIGDWIEMPKYGADGDVVEISLNTVKVQNWDKTIVTIPTAAFLSDSVKNWRGMKDSGGRRIKRHINIDLNTIKFCNKEMLERFSKIQYIQEYIKKKVEEVHAYNLENKADTSILVNGRHLTNVGTFRAYVEAYLKNHPLIHNDMTFLVRQLQPTETGLPIEIYVFTTDTRWPYYEAIQADIFDHILAVVHLFDLAVFQETAGQNYKIDIVSMPQVKAGSS